MCNFRSLVFALIALSALHVFAQVPAQVSTPVEGSRFAGIGRAATPAEVAAWDIDVRPDFKGLPAGSGTVARGQVIWEGKCASCHGVFGESNEVFNPLVGGTTADDIKTGHVASLKRRDYPGRTTFMKVAHISTLWDYIHRAMPWNAPKSLSVDDVYAVTAYMLNLAEIVPADFTLSNTTMADAQNRLPNRNGLTTQHAMWPGKEFGGVSQPDVRAVACMKDCDAATTITKMPEHSRDAHGNLADQNRTFGAQHGAVTVAQVGPTAGVATPSVSATAAPKNAMPVDLLQKHSCTACHAADSKVVGPSWSDISKKHAGKTAYLIGKIRSGGSGVWGSVPMPPQTLNDDEVGRIAAWLAQGMSR